MTNIIQYRIQEPFLQNINNHYDKYHIVQNTGPIPAEQKQPYDKYDIAQNTGTSFCSTGMVPVFSAISYLS